jgi:hypothetical protein
VDKVGARLVDGGHIVVSLVLYGETAIGGYVGVGLSKKLKVDVDEVENKVFHFSYLLDL